VFWPLTTMGAGVLVVQTGDTRFVVDCRVKPVALVGHVRMTLAPEGMMVSSGTMVSRKTVPAPP